MDAALNVKAIVWQVADGVGMPVRCTVTESGADWLLLIRRGAETTYARRCATQAVALQRAYEMWQTLTEAGCKEQRH